MERSQPTFTLPIPPSGSITCTQPLPKVYLLTFTQPPDNRMIPLFIRTLGFAFDIIEHKLPKGVVITTSGIGKFYSNGLDYESAIKTEGFFDKILYPFWRKILTYPMPTIALLNGHAFAGGLMTAMMHDYRLMNPHRGFLCLNELEFGAPLTPPMASIFRQKLPRPDAYRAAVLEAKRFNALEALKEGLVDGLGGLDEALALVREMKLVGKADSGVYGRLKEEMWRETLGFLEGGGAGEREEARLKEQAGVRRREEAGRAVDEWEVSSRNGKTKL